MLTNLVGLVVTSDDGFGFAGDFVTDAAVAYCLTLQRHYLRQLMFELIAHWNLFVDSLVLLV